MSNNYILQMADGSWKWLDEKGGQFALEQWGLGNNIILNGEAVANHMVSLIRRCTSEENEMADEQLETEQRKLDYKEGRKQIVETKENGETKFKIIDTTKQLNANNS